MTNSSIYLHPDWILPRYAGWQTVHRDAHYVMLEKRGLPLRRLCILSVIQASELFERQELRRVCDGKTLITLKIIPPDDAATPVARSHGLLPTPDAKRIFHKFTFVVDLTVSIEQLWMAMRPTNRNLCKKAEQADIKVRIEDDPSAGDIDRFFDLYGEMARLRGLSTPQRVKLEAMFSDRRLILGCAERDNAVLSMALVYLAGDAAMYLYGVSPGRNTDGAGQLLQWEVIRALKARGISRYDLGGVPRVDESDGIYKFKKGFGGQGTVLGPEFYWAPTWFRIIRRVRHWLQ